MKRIKHLTHVGKGMCLLAALATGAGHLQAQEKDKARFDSLAVKYKNDPAVYSRIKDKLEITIQDGALVATSYSTLEKLLLSDQSLSNYNKDYFFYSDFYDLNSFSGVAYLPNGKTYKKVDCSTFGSGTPRSFAFYDDFRYVVAYYSGLTKNAVTETKYSRQYADVHMLPEFDFQDGYEGLPVANATYEVVAPVNVKMKFVLKGENTSRIKETKEEKNGLVYYRFTASDMPAFKSFDHVPSADYYMPHVIPYIVSYKLDGAKKDSVLTSNTDDLYKYLYNYVRSRDLKVDSFLTKTVVQLTQNDISQWDKAAHIYKWVQDNIHYIAFENGLEGFIPRPADTVYKRKYGDCKDMAAITVAMCRKAGIEAHFTWIGTTDLPYEHTDLPLNILFNHMICAAKIDGKWVFIDGTNKMLPLGYNRRDIQGKEALIAIDENRYEIVKIPVEDAEKNVTIDSTNITIDGDKITGNVNQMYKGYDAWDLGYMLMYNKRDDDREKAVKAITERGSDKYIQSKYDISASKTGNKDVTVNAEFVVDDYVHRVGKQCVVNMNLLHYFENNEIDTKDRTVPSYYNYKNSRKEVVVLNLPKGYKVKYLPKAEKNSVDGLWNYSISYKAEKGKIILTKEYQLNTTAITADKFADNNKAIDGLKKIYKESVVLTTN